MEPEKPKTYFDQASWGNLETRVCGVVVAGTNDYDLFPGGSAFFVAPYIALTAAHVVDELFQRFEGTSPVDASGLLSFGTQITTLTPHGSYIKWDVEDYFLSPNIDIAALSVVPQDPLPDDFAWYLPQLEIIPPKVGSTIRGVGYPKSELRVFESEDPKIRIDPTISSGEVLEVYHQYRDSVMLPFPCAHTNFRIDGGMSGGPVINEKGRVCGVMTTSFSTEEDLEDQDSYLSLIWPVLGLDIASPLISLDTSKRYPLRRLIEEGHVYAANHGFVKIYREGECYHLKLSSKL